MSKNLNTRSKTAVVWDLSGSFLRQIVSFFVSITLARLLGPENFGIIGMSLVFISIADVFSDAGFTSGLIQQKDNKDITFSSIFYLNFAISLISSVIIILVSPYIAVFYEEPRIQTILMFLAMMPPIVALGKVQEAKLTIDLNFKSLTIRNIVATIVGGVLGLIAAFSDYGVYSLVIQQISMVITATIMLWFGTGWRPKFEFSFYEVEKLFEFSSFVFLDSLMRRVFLKADTIFIAKVFSPVILGFYSRAESLISQVQAYTTSSISKVIFPVLSQLQNDELNFKATYFRVFNIVSGLIVILIAPLFFLAYDLIIFLLGDRWEPTVILFQILLLSIIVGPHKAMMGKAILSKGLSKLQFKISLLNRTIRLLPIIVGLYFGINEFAIAVTVSSLTIFFILAFILDYKLKLNVWLQIKGFLIPNFIFIVFLILYFFFKDDFSSWLFTILFLLIHILFLMLLKHESFTFSKSMLSKQFKNIKTNSLSC